MRTAGIVLFTSTLVLPQVARAAEPPCLTPREATAVTAYALPSAISGTTKRCAPVLGNESWLAQNGDGLAARYGERKTTVWPEAKAALIKVGGGSGDQVIGVLKALPDATVQQVADTMVTEAVAEKVPENRCGVVDKFLSLISPLPAENTAELIALTLGVISHGPNPRLGKLAICKA